MTHSPSEQYILDRFAALEARQTALEQLVAEELEKRKLWPWEKDLPSCPEKPIPYWPSLPDRDNGDEARCRVCGNRYKDMNQYVCYHPNCPSKITCSS